MDKETIALIIAQNGLKTASGLVAARAARLLKKSESATDPAVKAKLKSDAENAKKLATALTIADAGITQYQIETAG